MLYEISLARVALVVYKSTNRWRSSRDRIGEGFENNLRILKFMRDNLIFIIIDGKRGMSY